MVMGPGPGNIPLYSTESVTFIKTRMVYVSAFTLWDAVVLFTVYRKTYAC